MKLWELDQRIQEVCPILGVNSDGVIWFAPEATAIQKAQANELMVQLLPMLELENAIY